eukprot:TRINITY_DN47870_c0_g1_i1.p2 TRINITY_DN47870_c0_g1~~TRINITY_DN47870_c0_g1_i1.p2  ORF type:complete len:166 (+),score=19.87 TRINITY_DN47870_c0_g1_i1:71-568(+)
MRWKRWLYGFTVDGTALQGHPVWLELKLLREGLYMQCIGVKQNTMIDANIGLAKRGTPTHQGKHVYTVSTRRMIRDCRWQPETVGAEFPACLKVGARECLHRVTKPTEAEVEKIRWAAGLIGEKYNLELPPRILLQICEREGNQTVLVEQYSEVDGVGLSAEMVV